MESKQWVAFVDNFISSVTKIVPFNSFFSYEVKNEKSDNLNSYHFRNLSENSVKDYLYGMCHYDPVFFKNNDKKEIVLLRESGIIPSEYQGFLQENQVADNIELFFKGNDVSLRGISLIRSSNEGFFSSKEIQIIESCYSLAKFHTTQIVEDFSEFNIPEKISNQLTSKEKKVMQLILKGRKNQEIADEIFVSLATVKTHLQHIFQKTMVNSKQELIVKMFS
ncbi:LuxR C-terminal-related transcriptional regulator [Acinetobacter sp.]|uniref:response regulator transcription factor n=1 Tax=Acinetobacter sp. TaxID=472 RepID=UPI0031D12D7A